MSNNRLETTRVVQNAKRVLNQWLAPDCRCATSGSSAPAVELLGR